MEISLEREAGLCSLLNTRWHHVGISLTCVSTEERLPPPQPSFPLPGLSIPARQVRPDQGGCLLGSQDWTDKGSHFPSKHAEAQSGRYSNSSDLTRTLTLSSGLLLLGRLLILPGPSCSPFIHGGWGKHLFSASPPRLPTAQGPRGKAGGPEPGPLLR